MDILVGFCVFISLFTCLFVFAHPSLATYVLIPIGLTVYQLFVVVMGDAANSLLNPQEASVLAHMPIGGLTYAAAKASHLILLVFLIVTASNFLPALAGLLLPGARWFFPLTLMLASYLAGFFVAFVICGTYGWLFHFVAPERMKGIAIGIQVFLFALVPMVSGLAISLMSALRRAHWQPDHWAWFPPNWFVSIALLGHAAPGFHVWQAVLAAAGTGLLIVLLSQTDQPQGAAVFLTLPIRNMGAFARGVYCSLWLPSVGIAHLLLIFPAIWFWGWRDALLFVIFSTALASLYLSAELFLMDGLPFANPVPLSAQALLLPVMLVGAPCAAILAFLQWLIFRSHTAAIIGTVSVLLLAVLVTRFSLRHMAKEFRANLLALGLGPSRLFKPIDSN